MKKIRILIVEDHQLIRKALAMVINSDPRFETVAEAGTGEGAVEMAIIHKPDIILMDINLQGMNGIDATTAITRICPAIKTIAMTMQNQAYFIERMMEAGAAGYLSKNVAPDELYKCLVDVFSGNRYLSAEIKETMLDKTMNGNYKQPRFKKLSRREMEIAGLIKDGKSSKQIAVTLEIATKTVEVHRYNILRKLNERNSISLVKSLHENPCLLDRSHAC